MPRRNDRKESLALRAAYARRRDWMEKLSAAKSAGDESLALEAKKFVVEYEGLIADLEKDSAMPRQSHTNPALGADQ